MAKSWSTIKIVLIFLLIISCATVYKHDYQNNCSNEALYCGLIASEQNEVRVSFGTTSNPLWDHVQAKVKIDGQWKWLYMIDNHCYLGKQDNFEIVYETSLRDFINYLYKTKRRIP